MNNTMAHNCTSYRTYDMHSKLIEMRTIWTETDPRLWYRLRHST